MGPTGISHRSAALVLVGVLAASGCGHSLDSLPPARGNMDPIVFKDNYGVGVGYQAFQGSKNDAVSVDNTEHHLGTASLKITIPGPGDPSGGFAGGAFTCNQARDLADYNALTFWAKASQPATLDVVGIGNDNTGTSKYQASWRGVALTTTWTRYVLPIPSTGKLLGERGLLFFAEGSDEGVYTVWLDDVEYANDPTIQNPRPGMPTQTLVGYVGGTVEVPNTNTAFTVDGVQEIIYHSTGYFEITSTDVAVAQQIDGLIRALAPGTSKLTAMLGTVPVLGTVTLNVVARPVTPAPLPGVPAGDVLSLFSNVYPNVTVDSWSTDWDQASVSDLLIGNDDIKVYAGLGYAAIDFATHQIDATAMTAYHMDVWLPAGNTFRVKLVDFGANGVFDGGGDDSQHELLFNAYTTPPLVLGSWVSLEIPLADFTGLTGRSHLAQIILSCDGKTAFVDNLYFHR